MWRINGYLWERNEWACLWSTEEKRLTREITTHTFRILITRWPQSQEVVRRHWYTWGRRKIYIFWKSNYSSCNFQSLAFCPFKLQVQLLFFIEHLRYSVACTTTPVVSVVYYSLIDHSLLPSDISLTMLSTVRSCMCSHRLYCISIRAATNNHFN